MNPEVDQKPPSILARLRSETRLEHEAIEAALELTSSTLTRDEYRRTLERFYGFYRPLEAKLSEAGGWTQRGLDLTERQKAPHLEADLRALGVAVPADLPVCADLPPHATPAAAFGCLYVMEGASLGGQIISRSIEKTLGVTPDTGGRFFHGYGDRTGPMWQAFRTALSEFAVTIAVEDEVVGAAKHTFEKLHRWLSAGGAAR